MTRERSLFTVMLVAGTLSVGAVGAHSLTVPFKGSATGAIIGQDVLGPNHVRLTTAGEGTATQLGAYTRSEVLDLDPATGAFTGTVTFTAANGDELNCDITGQFTSAADAAGDYTITSGTGRFAQASGQAAFRASMTGPATFHVTFAGDITW